MLRIIWFQNSNRLFYFIIQYETVKSIHFSLANRTTCLQFHRSNKILSNNHIKSNNTN